MNTLPEHDKEDTPSPTRRNLLAKLGLAAGVAYMAPVMLSLSQAHASGGSAPSRSSGPSAPSRASAPSRPSGPSRASGPSGPSRPRGTVHAGPPPGMTFQQWLAWLRR